jgi:hypothetical protein
MAILITVPIGALRTLKVKYLKTKQLPSVLYPVISRAFDHREAANPYLPTLMQYFSLDCITKGSPAHLALSILSLSLSLYGLQLFGVFEPQSLFQLLNLYIVGRMPWKGDQPVARPLHTHGTTQSQNKCIQASMPRVGFEPMIPVFEQVKMVHALDPTATVIGSAKLI